MVSPGVTWGMPWPRGRHAAGTAFALRSVAGADIPVQSWQLATWPDGSLKWTAHAVPADLAATTGFELAAGTPATPAKPLTALDSDDAIEIDTGLIVARVAKTGRVLIPVVRHDGREVLRDGRLVLLRQDSPEVGAEPELFAGEIGEVTLEQRGPVRAVVKIQGKHAKPGGGKAWLPFVVRLYFYAGGEAIRVMHTITYDGDEAKDFIRGLGLRFNVPLRGELYDRHVRFSGEGDGLFGEAVRTVTGLRRDPGAAVRAAQIAGEATPPVDTWNPAAGKRMHLVPAFGDWSLFQSSADGFEINKRTKAGFTWISPARGQRAGGLGYVGTPQGGVAFGIRNFWQSHPSELSIHDATGEAAEVTAWLWAPRAGAMDLRGYHDSAGLKTYAEQLEALEITYEDYEPGFDKPEGVARTSEMQLWALPATPSRERLAQFAEVVRTPPVLTTTPEYLQSCAVFGGLWSPVNRSTPARAALEDQLDGFFRFYETQREERRWYGFWNYGDVMHTYDADRHEWRYDVGGFAWDNSELSTDIWLWLYFLKTGRAGRRAPRRPFRAARFAAQRPPLGRQRQAAAHQHGGQSALLLLFDGRRARGRLDARTGRGGAGAGGGPGQPQGDARPRDGARSQRDRGFCGLWHGLGRGCRRLAYRMGAIGRRPHTRPVACQHALDRGAASRFFYRRRASQPCHRGICAGG
jgi:hypothetical protein